MRLKGSVAIKGRLTTTFASIPDVPLSRLALNLTGGPKGALTTTVDLCTSDADVRRRVRRAVGHGTLAVKSPAELVGCDGRGRVEQRPAGHRRAEGCARSGRR